MKTTLLLFISSLLLLACGGCGTSSAFIPGTIPTLTPGTPPTAVMVQQELASTNAIRNDLLVEDAAVDAISPADAAAADLLYSEGTAQLAKFDADYASGTIPPGDVISAVRLIIDEIHALKSPTATPAKTAALAHAARLKAK